MTEGLWVLCFIVGSLVTVLPLVEWLNARHGCTLILSFEEFHEYYMICPNNFILRNGWARCYFIDDYSRCHSYGIGFGFISWIEYCLWKKIILNIEKKKKLNEDYKNFVKHISGG